MHAELETVLSELHLSMERREAILAAAGRMTERENRRRPLRTGLMAAAICAALAVTAVAVSPPLRETLIQFLGSFEPLRSGGRGGVGYGSGHRAAGSAGFGG